MSLFHFEMKRQLATHFDNYTIDQILLKNSLTENEMWLANKVEKIPDEVINKFYSKEQIMNHLTKTDFIQYLNCPESLWLLKNKKEEYNKHKGEFSEFQQKIINE